MQKSLPEYMGSKRESKLGVVTSMMGMLWKQSKFWVVYMEARESSLGAWEGDTPWVHDMDVRQAFVADTGRWSGSPLLCSVM
jgi:hypothetical protein